MPETSLSLDEIRFKNKMHVLFTKGRCPVDANFCRNIFSSNWLRLDRRVFYYDAKVRDKKSWDNYGEVDDNVML